MKILKPLLLAALFAVCLPLSAQTPNYDDMTMESDEMETTFRPSGKNYVFLRSKRGSGGMNKTSAGDSIKGFPITDIVLVFTEVNESAFEEREDANKERWENLMRAYPEYFQTNTNYKSLCQCKIGGDSISFKKAQGFYVYFTPQAAPKKAEPVAVKTEEKKAEPAKVAEPKKEAATKTTATPEPVEAVQTPAKTAEPAKTENRPVETTVTQAPAPKEEVKEEPAPEESSSASATETKTVKKSTGAIKPRRARDSKACRPACYGGGQDDLNSYFKTNMALAKKERKKFKKLSSVASIQLNVDGSIKKVKVTGENETLNKKVEAAVNNMNNWNAAVKNGVTVKAEVKITLKYDKSSKSMQPAEIALIPRPNPKCTQCMSDSEIFGN